MPTQAKFIVWNVFGFAIGVAAVISGLVLKNLFSVTAGIAWIVTMILAVSTGQLVQPPGPDNTIGVTITFNKWYVWLICAAVMAAGIALGLAIKVHGWH
jgi:hypothetical protein